MGIYFILLLLSFIGSFLPYKGQCWLSYLLLFLMMLMCGLRGEDIGKDTSNYILYYHGYGGESFGPLYNGLRFVLYRFFGNHPTSFLMALSVLTYIPLMTVINKESRKPCLSVLLYMSCGALYFLETFNIVRQSIAIVFILHSAMYLKYGNYKNSILFLIIAFLFHPFTIVFSSIYFFIHYKLSYTSVIGLIVVSLILGLIGIENLIGAVLNAIQNVTSSFSFVLITHLGKYSTYDYLSSFSFIGKLTHMLPISIVCILLYDKTMRNNIYYIMMVIGTVLLNITISTSFCERFASTFTISQIILIANYFYYIKDKVKLLIMSLMMALIIILYIYNMFEMAAQVGANYPIPYKAFWH